MKIKKIDFYLENLELARPYTIASHTVDAVENLFVELHLANGIVGVGAANPSKAIAGESVAEAYTKLQRGAADWLLHRDIRWFRALLGENQRLNAKYIGVAAAIDLALYDAFTKYLGVSVGVFLGTAHAQMPTSITIGIKSVTETLEEAHEYVGRKFHHLKVKLGHSVEEDIERLAKLREIFGNQIALRVDANQGYSLSDLRYFYDRTQGLALELIEQPLAATEVAAMRELPLGLRSMIAADESLTTPQTAWHLLKPSPACGIFNIKLMKCGGITPALTIASFAAQDGVLLMWGCNDESEVSITAALHAAFSCPHTQYIDLDGSFDLAHDVATHGFMLVDGVMRPRLDQPGLGFQFRN